MHSGVFGGTVHEGMADLMYMMNTLVDKDGKILVEGIQDEVAPVTPGKYKCNVGYGIFGGVWKISIKMDRLKGFGASKVDFFTNRLKCKSYARKKF